MAELDGEVCAELPTRNLLSGRKSHSRRFRRVKFFRSHNNCDFNRGFGEERFDNGFGGGIGFGGSIGFGGVSNFNATSQSIFNPQTAVAFGGGGIAQIGANRNINSSVQFGF